MFGNNLKYVLVLAVLTIFTYSDPAVRDVLMQKPAPVSQANVFESYKNSSPYLFDTKNNQQEPSPQEIVFALNKEGIIVSTDIDRAREVVVHLFVTKHSSGTASIGNKYRTSNSLYVGSSTKPRYEKRMPQ